MSLLNTADAIYLGGTAADRLCLGVNPIWASLAKRAAAATAAGNADIANGGTPFWSEMGGPTGAAFWNNSNTGFGDGSVIAGTPVTYASVTKTLAACIALSILGTPSADVFKLLCMIGGYDWMQGNHCASGDTIHSCAITPYTNPLSPLYGKTYTSYDAAHDGLFSYDSAPWQRLFDSILGFGGDDATALANRFISQFSLTIGTLACTSCMPAGGARSTANVLRKIIQQIMTGTGGGAAMKAHHMDPSFAPVNASNLTGGSPGVFYSPAPLDQRWDYMSGLWYNHATGDRWMAGSAGSVVWIKKDWSMYGMVVRNGGDIDGALSMATMQSILDAWNAGYFHG